jgi:phosphoribosylformylglycinamidine (FGAM) synthase-like enzyme
VAVTAQRNVSEVDQQIRVGCVDSSFGHPTIVPYRGAATAVGSRG